MPLTQTCTASGKTFEITDDDLQFYAKMEVPPPTLCPEERMRRRMAWRNEKHLYARKCDATGKAIVSIFDPQSPFQVYSQEYWWSDQWDAQDYAQDFDFNRPFFEQFKTLQEKVPRICLLSKNAINSEYTNHAANNKDCYMSVIIFNSEKALFSRKIFTSRDVTDCDFIFRGGEQLYDCFFCENLYQAKSCHTCFNSRDLAFCIDCRGCGDCFMSSNLRNQQYVFYNQTLTKEAYEAKMRSIHLGSFQTYQKLKQDFEALKLTKTVYPDRRLHLCENITGDFLAHCKDCHECYYSSDGENIRYSCDFDASNGSGSRNCTDCFGFGGCELIYEVQAQSNGYNNRFCSWSYDVKDSTYLDMCHNAEHCFGCVGLKHKKFCILNKPYTEEAYNALVPKIIEHMKSSTTTEWGEFFPISMSPFAYNQTIAQEYFPLDQTQASQRGYLWKTDKSSSKYIGESFAIPDDIKDVKDDICTKILTCQSTGKHYRIIKLELDFYRKMGIPIPRLHPDLRQAQRKSLQNPHKLYDRQCHECQKAIQTTFAPDRPEKVMCEACYLTSLN